MNGYNLLVSVTDELEKVVELINTLYKDNLIQETDEAWYLKSDIEYDLDAIQEYYGELKAALMEVKIDLGKEE